MFTRHGFGIAKMGAIEVALSDKVSMDMARCVDWALDGMVPPVGGIVFKSAPRSAKQRHHTSGEQWLSKQHKDTFRMARPLTKVSARMTWGRPGAVSRSAVLQEMMEP